MATLLTKKSDTSSSVPLAADLTNAAGGAELAVNTADKRLYTKTSGGSVVELGTNPSSLALPNGTANGVAYLNGSKVLTSGSALTFDGSALETVSATSAQIAAVRGTQRMALGADGFTNAYVGTTTAHDVSFLRAGSEQMRLTSTGLGIGTSSPAVPLHVYNDNAVLRLQDTVDGVTAAPSIQFWDSNSQMATIGYLSTSNNDLDIFQAEDAAIDFWTNSAQRMRIGNAGNVGIGTSSPSSDSLVHVFSASDKARVSVQRSGVSKAWFGQDGGGEAYIYNEANAAIRFYNNSTERARIDSSGNLLVGGAVNTASSKIYLETTDNGLGLRHPNASSGLFRKINVGSDNALYIQNQDNTGVFLSASSTSWGSVSDERMKTTLTPFENPCAKVMALRAGVGRYLSDPDEVSRSFLIAQDVQAVLPEAVSVQADEQGTLGLRYTDTIPLLVAAIQEQQALINELKARLDAANL